MFTKIRICLLIYSASFFSHHTTHCMERPVGILDVIAATAVAYDKIYLYWNRDNRVLCSTFTSGTFLTGLTGFAIFAIENSMVGYFKNNESYFLTTGIYKVCRTLGAFGCGILLSNSRYTCTQIQQNKNLINPYLQGLVCGAACLLPVLYPQVRIM